MIVDLERNDLSRVAVTGSVESSRCSDVAPWSGLWHAGSLVAATLSPDATHRRRRVLRALLPAAR
jgi:anthranilate/para-aminobenzoate synthase component I